METPDLLPTRLNFDAIVFAGCTMKEIQLIAGVSLSVCMVLLALLTKLLLGMLLIGVGLSFPAGVALTWVLAHLFQRTKQGKPKGYVRQRLFLTCEDKGLLPPIFCRRSGKWSVGKCL